MADEQERQPAIRSDNLIRKMAFVIVDDTPERRLEFLRSQLADFRLATEVREISKQAIDGWFKKGDKKSYPKRNVANTFLYQFLKENYKESDFQGDRKKVYKQCVSYLYSRISSDPDDFVIEKKQLQIIGDKFGNITINQADINRGDISFKLWSGVYLSFRMRVFKNKIKPISREIISISSERGSMSYEHWHLRDGVNLSKFTGNAIIFNRSIYFIGTSLDGKRLRACHFQNTGTTNPAHGKMRWGLMHGDIPAAGSVDPVSTRIFLVKIQDDTSRSIRIARQYVEYINESDIDIEIRDIVMRCINNRVTSKSAPEGYSPLGPDEDILRVNQSTLDNIFNLLISDA